MNRNRRKAIIPGTNGEINPPVSKTHLELNLRSSLGFNIYISGIYREREETSVIVYNKVTSLTKLLCVAFRVEIYARCNSKLNCHVGKFSLTARGNVEINKECYYN